MGDGYRNKLMGEAAMRQKIKDQERQIASIRSAHKLFSAVIGAGGVTITDGGSLRITDGVNWFLNAAPFDFTVYTIDANGNLGGPFAGMNPGEINVAGADLSMAGGLHVNPANNTVELFYVGTAAGVAIEHPTTAAAANAVLDAVTGLVSRSTSSRRYKQDVEDLEQVDLDAVLKLQPRTWRDRAEVEADPDTERRYVGLVAEEVDELGLREFIVYDEDGAPEAISYPLMFLPVLELAKAQQKQIDDLTERLERLEGKR